MYEQYATDFWAKVDRRGPDECWLYTGARQRTGYGNFTRRLGPIRFQIAAHRLAWMLTHGPIADGLFVCHRCDNPPCVNPAHLFAGTPRENTQDMLSKSRHSHGEARHCARLSDSDVVEMRRLRRRGVPVRVLAASFGVSRSAAADAISGRRWSHVDGAIGTQDRKRLASVEVRAIQLDRVEGASSDEIARRYGISARHARKIANR